jgi:hypothetical protein
MHERAKSMIEQVPVELVFRHVLAAADAVHELDQPGDSTPAVLCITERRLRRRPGTVSTHDSGRVQGLI